MATKKELIGKLNEACARVLKQSDFAGGVVASLSVVIDRLTALRDQIKAAGDMDPNAYQAMYDELYECGRVIGSIYDGFPMVPAEDFAGAGEGVQMTASEVLKMCTTTLEKAASLKGLEAGIEVAVVKGALAAWEALGDEDPADGKVTVLSAATLAKLAKACGNKKTDEKTKKEQAEAAAKAAASQPATPANDDTIAKIDSIAKAAAPAPAPKFVWAMDMNG